MNRQIKNILAFGLLSFVLSSSFALGKTYLLSQDELTDGTFRVHGNVEWVESEEAFYFDGDGSYLELDNPLSEVSPDTGFMISFEAKIANDNPAWGRIFDMSDGCLNADGTRYYNHPQKYFFINGGKKGVTDEKGNGNQHLRFAFATTGYNGDEVYTNMPAEYNYFNKWVKIVLIVAPGGSSKLFVDDDEVSNLNSSDTVTSVLNNLGSFTSCNIGTSMFQTQYDYTTNLYNEGTLEKTYGFKDGYFKGYLKRFRIVPNGTGVATIYPSEELYYSLTEALSAIKTFPAKVLLSSSVYVDSPIAISKDITIDCQNNTIYGKSDTSTDDLLFTVSKDCTFGITNGTCKGIIQDMDISSTRDNFLTLKGDVSINNIILNSRAIDVSEMNYGSNIYVTGSPTKRITNGWYNVNGGTLSSTIHPFTDGHNIMMRKVNGNLELFLITHRDQW